MHFKLRTRQSKVGIYLQSRVIGWGYQVLVWDLLEVHCSLQQVLKLGQMLVVVHLLQH